MYEKHPPSVSEFVNCNTCLPMPNNYWKIIKHKNDNGGDDDDK